MLTIAAGRCVPHATNQVITKLGAQLNHPCTDVNLCKLKDKHPELQNAIRTLQRDLKELEQKYEKAKNDNDVFVAARQRAKSSFFAVMRPRLKCQNPAKYLDRGALDRDLMVLQRALQNKVPVDEGLDWRLPGIIEEYKRGNVNVHLNQPNPSQSYDLPSVDTAWHIICQTHTTSTNLY